MNVVNIHVPPLRERIEEFPVFMEYFLDKYGKKYGKKVRAFSEKAAKIFLQYPWPGNVRELENFVHRYVVLGNEEELLDEFVPCMGLANRGVKRMIMAAKRETLTQRNPARGCPEGRI